MLHSRLRESNKCVFYIERWPFFSYHFFLSSSIWFFCLTKHSRTSRRWIAHYIIIWSLCDFDVLIFLLSFTAGEILLVKFISFINTVIGLPLFFCVCSLLFSLRCVLFSLCVVFTRPTQVTVCMWICVENKIFVILLSISIKVGKIIRKIWITNK